MSNDKSIPLPSLEELRKIETLNARIAENLAKLTVGLVVIIAKLQHSADEENKLDIYKTIERIGVGLEKIEKLIPKIEPLKSAAALKDIHDTFEEICEGLSQIGAADFDGVQVEAQSILRGLLEVEKKKESVN
jgi:hypothetical protein